MSVVLPHYRPDELESLLAWDHPDTAREEAPLEAFIAASRDYFNGKNPDFSGVAVDLPGETTFSGIVLRACREIPYGQTMSYSQLAMKIGREDSARAVATALSKNAVPLAIPCHRVIYAGGGMGGFNAVAGVELKKRMVDLEARTAPAR